MISGLWQKELDTDLDPTARLSVVSGIRAVSLVLGDSALRRIALSSATFASLQFVYTSFFVAIVTEQRDYP